MADKEPVGYYSPQQAERIWRAVQQWERSAPELLKGNKRSHNDPPQRPIYIENVSGLKIPKFGCVQAVGTRMLNDQCFIQVDRPADVNGEAGPFFLNLFADIPAVKLESANEFPFGCATDGPHANALCIGLPAGTKLQPKVGTWELEEGGGIFRMIGPNTGQYLGEKVQRVTFNGSPPGTEIIRFKFEEYEYGGSDRQSVLIWVEASGLTNPSEPGSDPPLREHAKIIFHGHAFDVESNPYGSNYHQHLWLIEWCALGTEDLYGYHLELQGDWLGMDWSTDSGTYSPPDKDSLIESKLIAPSAYEREIFFDNEPTGCDPNAATVKCSGGLAEKRPGGSGTAKVISRPCGVERVSGETDSGHVRVVDNMEGSFLGGRDPDSWAGKEGIAVYVHDDGDENCYWLITWMDWFVEKVLVDDIIVTGTSIVIERSANEIWRTCTLPSEEIEGTNCGATYG